MENLTGTRVDGTSPDEGANLYEGGEQARNMADYSSQINELKK